MEEDTSYEDGDYSWVELTVEEVSSSIIRLVSEHINEILNTEEYYEPQSYHVTLFHGYESRHTNKIVSLIKGHLSKPIELTLGRITLDRTHPVIRVGIEPHQLLSTIFNDLRNHTPNCHMQSSNDYEPHLTIAKTTNYALAELEIGTISRMLEGLKIKISKVRCFGPEGDMIKQFSLG